MNGCNEGRDTPLSNDEIIASAAYCLGLSMRGDIPLSPEAQAALLNAARAIVQMAGADWDKVRRGAEALPRVNEFRPGDRVRLELKDFIPLGKGYTSLSGKLATVKYSYAALYGTKDAGSARRYCLDVDGIGAVAWYDADDLEAIL